MKCSHIEKIYLMCLKFLEDLSFSESDYVPGTHTHVNRECVVRHVYVPNESRVVVTTELAELHFVQNMI